MYRLKSFVKVNYTFPEITPTAEPNIVGNGSLAELDTNCHSSEVNLINRIERTNNYKKSKNEQQIIRDTHSSILKFSRNVKLHP